MRRLAIAVASALLLRACKGGSRGEPNPGAAASSDPARFVYTRIYCTPDSETHMEPVTMELAKKTFAPPAPPVYVGSARPISSAFVSGFEPHWGAQDLEAHLNHPAPAAMYAAVLGGSFSVTTTDGATKGFRPGDLLLLEDTSPCKGHLSVVSDQPVYLMFAR